MMMQDGMVQNDLIEHVIVGVTIGASAAIGWIVIMWVKAKLKWRWRIRRWVALARKSYANQATNDDIDEEIEIWNTLTENEKDHAVLTAKKRGFLKKTEDKAE